MIASLAEPTSWSAVSAPPAHAAAIKPLSRTELNALSFMRCPCDRGPYKNHKHNSGELLFASAFQLSATNARHVHRLRYLFTGLVDARSCSLLLALARSCSSELLSSSFRFETEDASE